MDAFVSRKKRKLSSPKSKTTELDKISALSAPDDESTDFKLALLSSLHPYIEQQVLLDVLLAHEGSVEKTSASLKAPDSPPKKSSAATGYQSSLSGFVTGNDAVDALGKKMLSKKGKTLHLYSPEDVAKHTPCSIIHNFLPTEEANALLEELLEEAPTFDRMTFKLFDNVVQSPHTACFYVEGMEELRRQKTEYIYNGGLLTDVRQLTPQMRKVSPKVQEAVNSEITTRIKTHYPNGRKLKYQSPDPWRPNAAFVNCYSGGNESVGYHSDQLTYLGPRAVIGSISLGVAREFRVRRIIPQEEDSSSVSPRKKPQDSTAADAQGQIAIHLPHNSLLVMHAEMQEEWKHSIAPAQAIDPHPVSGNKRINITYRDYKPSLHPRFTPRCRCDVPAVLRVVQRKRENWGKYFWMCHAGNVEGKEGCSFFQWAVFGEDGEPVWKGEQGN
ncbi:Alpha-ketoglutarate-dependent dioxygenase-like protein [Lachnellula subtilissima]|uniref:Alpha-ketoglutarate-dependent dioxygenase-like protein n=1 Tax=Lachnellula subtilissima TaxID=602034 RepID=A0A8H8RPA6_9HELO|nr:Alpha-ketoglutarate-dependent dioxygenase-like protein [Lachnellula subtilissima]